MSSTSQGLFTGGLPTTGAGVQGAVSKKPVSTLNNDDKSLNNNDFSKVLKGQSTVDKRAVLSSDKKVLATGEVSPEQALTTATAVQGLALDRPVDGPAGKSLPTDGLSLPLKFLAHDEGDVPLQAGLIATDNEQPVVTEVTGALEGGEAEASLIEQPQDGTEATTISSSAPVANIQVQQSSNKQSDSAAAKSAAVQSAPLLNAAQREAVGQPATTDSTAITAATATEAAATSTMATAPLTAASNRQNSMTATSLTIAKLTHLKSQQSTGSPNTAAAELASNTLVDDKTTPTSLPGRVEGPVNTQSQPAAALATTAAIEVGKPGWSDTVMQRVMWMSSQNVNKAEIALDPPELGPLQVRITTQADQTSITFTSNHAVVRDALDQSMPRLREMMDDQGLDLADVDVSSQDSQQHGQATDDSDGGDNLGATENNVTAQADQDLSTDESLQQVQVSRSSLVDQYV